MAKSTPLKNLDAEIALAIANRDIAALDQLQDQLFREAKRGAETAFAPAIEFKPAARRWAIDEEEGLLGDIAVATANKISRAKRRIAYELKVLGGFDGLRIASDGDSWFMYPLPPHRDIIDNLSADADKAILSVDGAGDEVANMAAEQEYHDALETANGHVLLFSAGGNDLLGGGRFLELLKPFTAGTEPADLIKDNVLRRRVDAIVGDYRKIVRDVGTRHPNTTVIGHGYDLSFPKKGGKWLGQALEDQRIPLSVGRRIVGIVVDRFNEALAETARQFPHYRHIDLRGRVGQGEASWFDELHPQNDGYSRAAEAFREELSTIAQERAPEFVSRAIVSAGRDRAQAEARRASTRRREHREAAGATIVIDPGHGGTRDLACSDANHAVGPVHRLLEKDLTLDVAQRVKRLIDSVGRHTCLLTRDRDENLSGHDRADVARRSGAAVFLSIHFNASTGHNAQGTETWVHSQASNTGASAELCRAMQAAVRRATGLADRNSLHPPHFIKKANFCVVNPDNHADDTAAALVEVSFLDRADEEQRLTRDSYRDEIAAAIVAGLDTYLGAEAVEGAHEAAMAEAELQDGVSYYAERARMVARVWANELVEDRAYDRAAGAAVSMPRRHGERTPRHGALGLFARAAVADDHDSAGVDSGEFRRVPIGDAPDYRRAASDEHFARAVVDEMFGSLESEPFDFDAFGRLITGLGLKHFMPIEFLFLGGGNEPGAGRCAGKNALPAEDLWNNIVATARMLDAIRERLGAPIKILSGYRNEDYNRCIGGENASLHMRFNAIDWTCARGDPEDWLDVARAVRASSPQFSGGVGFYPDKRFIHIDTRGTDKNW